MPIIHNGIEYLYVEDIHEQYGFTLDYIRHMAREGRKKPKGYGLKGIKIGRRWAFRPSAVEKHLVTDFKESDGNEKQLDFTDSI